MFLKNLDFEELKISSTFCVLVTGMSGTGYRPRISLHYQFSKVVMSASVATFIVSSDKGISVPSMPSNSDMQVIGGKSVRSAQCIGLGNLFSSLKRQDELSSSLCFGEGVLDFNHP